MARLLVSVRSEAEARAALAGGAAIIDVKEPSRGSLGMASCATWRSVRRSLPPSMVVSVALGELTEWIDRDREEIPADGWGGISLRKVGLAGVGPDWRDRWDELRDRLDGSPGTDRPAWVAVAYLDWRSARAPDPMAVIAEASGVADCRGILFDTWDKSRRIGSDPGWEPCIRRARESGRFVALAGSLDEAAIRRWRPLEPDIFAVRGAACRGGDRNAAIDPERVARLVEAAATNQASPTSNRTPCASGSVRP